MSSQQPGDNDGEFRYGAAHQNASSRDKRRWNRQLRAEGFTRSGAPPSDARFVVESALEMAHILKRYAGSALHQKYIVKLTVPIGSGRRRTTRAEYRTLTTAYIDRLINGHHTNSEEVGGYEYIGSDFESTEDLIESASGPLTMEIRAVSQEGGWSRPGGEFLKWWIDFDVIGCENFRKYALPILERIQLYERETSSDNYTTPCLINSLQESGVDEGIIDSIKRRFMRSKISRTNIKHIIDESASDIQLHVRTLGDKNLTKFGKGTNIKTIALIEDHYIPIIPTNITSYALKNFQDLKHKERWWEFIDNKRRINERQSGLDSWELLKNMFKIPDLLKPLSCNDERVYKHIECRMAQR